MIDDFALNPKLDRARLRSLFAEHGRIEIRDFLADDGAPRLREHLLGREDWRLVLNAGRSVYDIPRGALAGLDEAQRRELDERVNAAARSGFHYRYESIRVPDAEAARDSAGTLLERFVSFMSSDEVLGFLGEVIEAPDLAFADGQATSYSRGHFLTRHDDAVEGKHRRAAYVFGLQPDWNADWGGLLMFHGADGNIVEAYTPAMGALRLFRVPAAHSVSCVAPFAPAARLSVTGWLRTQRPDQSTE